MASTASTMPQGVTFGPAEEAVARRVEAAEGALYNWALGVQDAASVRRALKLLGVHLLERLNPHGGGRIDANVDGFGPLTLTF